MWLPCEFLDKREFINRHRPWLQLDRLASSGQFVHFLSILLDGRVHWWHLEDRTGEFRHGGGEFIGGEGADDLVRPDRFVRYDDTFGVQRLRRRAQHKFRLVRLVHADVLGNFFGRLASNGHDEKSGGKRVQSAGVADGSFAGNSAQAIDHIMAGWAGRFINE